MKNYMEVLRNTQNVTDEEGDYYLLGETTNEIEELFGIKAFLLLWASHKRYALIPTRTLITNLYILIVNNNSIVWF